MKKRSDGRYVKKVTLSNGKPKYLYSSAPNEREANKDFNRQLIALNEEDVEKTMFCNVSDAWASEHFESLEYNTLKAYKPGLRDVDAYFKDYHIEEVQPHHVCAFRDGMIRKGFAQKTIKGRMLVLNLIMKYAVSERLIVFNPCADIKLPKNLPKTKRLAQTPDETELIIQNADTPFGVLAYFYLFTGCRRGEALALKPSDIDRKKKVVKVHSTVVWKGSKPYIKDHPKTDAGNREIPLADKVLELITPYMKQTYLFQNSDGELYNNSQVTRGWGRYQKRTGITATPHQLRHGYATMLFDAGIDVKTAQRWMGHADIKTTLDIYTHLSELRQVQSADKLFKFISDNFLTT